MRLIRVLVYASLAMLAACSHAAKAAPTQGSLPPLLIDDRGVTMPLEEVVTKIAYRPWIPPRQVIKFAVIPPLGDTDTPQHRGVAVEYDAGRRPMLLSEWPKQNFTLLFLQKQDITSKPCTIVHYKTDGVAWTSRNKLAMTLQPDGTSDPKSVEIEAGRLIAAGACS